MRREGLTVVELLLAAAVGSLVLTAGFLTVRKEAKNLATERAIALSHDQAARALQGLSGELKDRPIAFILPGANERGATLVTLAGRGAYVPWEGYEPDTNKLPVLAEEGQFQPGRPLALVSALGEALYVPALAGAREVDPARGVWELDLGRCANPLLWTGNMRAYPAEALTVEMDPDSGGLRIQGTALESQRVLALRDFAFRYVYAGVDGEQIYPDYRGASLPDGSRLVALAFMSVSGGEASRAFTARLPVEGTGAARVTRVSACGNPSDPPPPPPPPPNPDPGILTLTVTLSTPLGDDPVPLVRAQGIDSVLHQTWGTASYPVRPGTYTITVDRVSRRFTREGFTREGMTFDAVYDATAPGTVTVPEGGTATATVTYDVVRGRYCRNETRVDFFGRTYQTGGCGNLLPGVYELPAPFLYYAEGIITNTQSTNMGNGVRIVQTETTYNGRFLGYDFSPDTPPGRFRYGEWDTVTGNNVNTPNVRYRKGTFALGSGDSVSVRGTSSPLLFTAYVLKRDEYVNGVHTRTLAHAVTYQDYVYCGGGVWREDGSRTVDLLTGGVLRQTRPSTDPCSQP